MGVRRWITERLLDFLTEPLSNYQRHVWNDPTALRRHIRKGDVLLVEGDSRVAAIIKYLTQSSWSHSTLYVGDELLRRGGDLAARALDDYGEDADALLVEALPEGVVASSLSKYIDYNIRLLRPHRLRPEHRKVILDDAVSSIGWRYDLRNVLDLARYFLPVTLVPSRFRRTALHFGSGAPTEVICSSLLGQLFQKVRFPVLPNVEFPDRPSEPAGRAARLLEKVLGRESSAYTGLFRMRHPTILTPRDFDLSPYFEVVKFNKIAAGSFDYERIQWVVDPEPPTSPESACAQAEPGHGDP